MYLITSTKNEPGTLDTLPKTENLSILNSDELRNSNITFNENTQYAITTEGVINDVIKKTTCKNKANATKLLKDKVLFRETIANLFSDFNFFNIKINDLPSINVKNKMVVKPRKGFFGTGIRYIDANTDLEKIKTEITIEIAKNGKSFANSETILSTEELLVEDYIGGDEFAVDMFYDNNGKPQILNIYAHPVPKNEAYIHALYYSSRKTHEKIAPKALEIFKKLNETLQVKNYIIHAEFKLDGNKFIPIEMNPLRLGGMGLGNMVYYALGINPYQFISEGKAPNWEKIWNLPEHKNAIYNFLIAYNGTNVNVNTQKPNIDKLKQDLGQVLNETLFDYQKNLVFGIFTSKETEESMTNLKNIEFNNYFE